LTFDDGPVPDTSRLLRILRHRRVTATFYQLGSMIHRYPDQARAVVAGGHELGVHAWSHRDFTRLSVGTIRRQLSSTIREIGEVTGTTPTMFRPPYGATNRTVLRLAAQAGLAEVSWNVDTLDWKSRHRGLVTRRAVTGARPGSIILLHDIHPTTVSAVPGIIDGLRRRGFTLVTVSQLIGADLAPGVRYGHR
jgi:peptidoglycan-N-acetylglucosamine deacetylase